MTSQRAWQLRRLALGLCVSCGQRPVLTGERCASCALRYRTTRRERLGAAAWTPGSRIRRPFISDAELRLLARKHGEGA